MQLGKSETLGVLDDYDAGIGHVDAYLDHRGRHQNGEAAGGKRRYDSVLVLAREPPMHEADLVPEAFLELNMALLSGSDIERLGFGHERADPIDLSAGSNGAGESFHHFLLPLARHNTRCHRLPPWRLLVQPRDVHVAVAGKQ